MLNYFLLLSIFTVSSSSAANQKPKVNTKINPTVNSTINPTAVAATPTPTPSPAIPDRHLKYYEIGKTNEPPIYLQKIQYQKAANGEVTAKVTVTDMKGATIYTETTVTQGTHLILQTADHMQSKKHLEVEVTTKDERVCLRTGPLASDPDSKEKPKESCERVPENFLTGATCETFVLEHIDDLMKDETIHVKLGVLDMREVVGFKFWKKEMTKINDRDVMVIAMKPSSIFISLLVNTIYIYVDVKDKKLVKYVGRTPLWIPVKDDLKPLDAELVFDSGP